MNHERTKHICHPIDKIVTEADILRKIREFTADLNSENPQYHWEIAPMRYRDDVFATQKLNPDGRYFWICPRSAPKYPGIVLCLEAPNQRGHSAQEYCGRLDDPSSLAHLYQLIAAKVQADNMTNGKPKRKFQFG